MHLTLSGTVREPSEWVNSIGYNWGFMWLIGRGYKFITSCMSLLVRASRVDAQDEQACRLVRGAIGLIRGIKDSKCPRHPSVGQNAALGIRDFAEHTENLTAEYLQKQGRARTPKKNLRTRSPANVKPPTILVVHAQGLLKGRCY